MRKRIFASGGFTTIFLGPGRPEYDPKKEMPSFETYLRDTADGTLGVLKSDAFDEGVIGSFMAGRFIKQANLPGFLPFMIPSLEGKPCLGVEGACGTGGRAIGVGARSLLSDLADAVFVVGFEIQNTMKSVYVSDVLAGAAYYNKQRKGGHAYFFPGLFSDRTGAYFQKYGGEKAREAMATWYVQAIENARKNPKSQEYANKTEDLFAKGMTPPDPDKFLPYLNPYDCSKISDGAASIGLFTEEGLERFGIKQCVEIIAIGEAEGDITKDPEDLTSLSTTVLAVRKALEIAGIGIEQVGLLEVHDCFSITALLALEAIGIVKSGEAPDFILGGETKPKGSLPTNLSGGLIGFGHPTGGTGVRQLVDLQLQLTGQAENQITPKNPYGMMISMGGNDKTVTCILVKEVS